jgi:hypothetical protein
MGKKLVVLAGLVAIGSTFMTPALAHYRHHYHYQQYRPYPAACESVWFPRSPLCGNRAPTLFIYW